MKRSGSEGSTKNDKWCSFHKTSLHNTSDCYNLKQKEATEQKRMEAKPQSKRRESKRYSRIYKNTAAQSDSNSYSELSSSEEMKFVDLV
ncbi:hypothetical protein PR003_g1245 [Phytophthora rubi]|uniref:Uncharacterized protein n=1 Tax=Phytophthora rubi TaxID=129364 RepID=A0A6A3NWT0_9STRA|nr:hypothetical protein PR002_g1940 [Phytophthora rubi]KAE9046899.1 hypothetical protein PR001_g4403 [Phytophthora rubi]KAE9358497.1 hypothetical protein PR003_g1245 [Phytophthora rubi]